MKNSKKIIYFSIALVLTSGFFGFFTESVFASSTGGTIDPNNEGYKYAWGENIGWLNFGTTEGNIHVTDSALTGYIWAENIGWISLNCSNGSSCATVDYKVANNGEGTLTGYAWSENTGWINFNPTYGGVTINSSGEFLGYAWGENIGWVVFNCSTTNSCGTVDYKVKTDWRPRSARPACNNSIDDDGDGKIDYPNDPGCDSLTDTNETDSAGQGLPPSAYNPPSLPSSTSENPEGKFSVMINNGDKYTTSEIVKLKFYAGKDTKRMAISNTPDFKNASQISYQEEIEWKLDDEIPNPNSQIPIKSQIPNPKLKTVYAKFYTSYGQSSTTVSDSVILTTKNPESTISPRTKPISSPTLPETPSPPASTTPPIPPMEISPKPSESPAQPPEQPLIQPSSKPPIEEPKTPPPFSQPSEPPKPTEPIQTKPTELAPAESTKQLFSFVGDFWQSAKMTLKNISSATTTGFNNLSKRIADLFDKSKDSFIVFTEDIKTLGDEIKFAIFENSQPLQISDVRVILISPTSAEIVWKTNYKATSKINYGLSRIYDMEKQDSKKVKNHSVILIDLKPGATYHYEAISQNGSYVYDADRIFVTPEK